MGKPRSRSRSCALKVVASPSTPHSRCAPVDATRSSRTHREHLLARRNSLIETTAHAAAGALICRCAPIQVQGGSSVSAPALGPVPDRDHVALHPQASKNVQQPGSGISMIEGRERPGVTCPSTRRWITISEPFNEAVISRSAVSAACRGRWSSHRILLWRSGSGGDVNGSGHPERVADDAVPPPDELSLGGGRARQRLTGRRRRFYAVRRRRRRTGRRPRCAGLPLGLHGVQHAVSANTISSVGTASLISGCYCRGVRTSARTTGREAHPHAAIRAARVSNVRRCRS